MFMIYKYKTGMSYLNPRKPGDPCKYIIGVVSSSPVKFQQ